MVSAGRLRAAIGASRSGKSAYVQSQTKGAKRLLVWDVKGEYSKCHRATSRAELVRLVRLSAGKAGRIAFVPPSLADFDYFCRVAATWVQSHYLVGRQSALIFEETADVTSPGKAPASYGILLRRFLAYGVDIYAVTQRPAESDKTAVGNASEVRLCRLQLDRDRKAAAADTGVPLSVVQSLRADQDAGRFDYVHVDAGAGNYRRGELTFKGGAPVFRAKGGVVEL